MKTWQFMTLHGIFMVFVFVGFVALSNSLRESHDATIRQQTIQEFCR